MARIQTTVEVFQYPAGPEPRFPCFDGLDIDEAADETAFPAAGNPGEEVSRARPNSERIEETRHSSEDAYERGLEEGRQLERDAQSAARVEEEHNRARRVAGLVQSFVEERDRYLQSVEHEVVELALAVAARILRREAQMDPLLLTGAVRVALGQLASSTEVRLRVPAAELALWTEAMAHVPNLTPMPAVLAGQGMRLGDCVIETELGSVDLGIRSQLGEIERGFFDRAVTGVAEATAHAGATLGSEAENKL